MEKTFCSNPDCILNSEYRGGQFRMVDGKWYCLQCSITAGSSSCRNLYEFDTTHLTGYKIHVKDKGHLRRLEKEHGVSSVVLNNYERNWK